MRQSSRGPGSAHSLSARLGVVLGLLTVAGVFVCVAPALAAYEQVGIFAGSLVPPVEPEVFPEEVQLGGVGGMAVNINGAGGVPAGTVYAVNDNDVAMFTPKAGGGLRFSERWQVGTEEPFEHCGPEGELPDGELVHSTCTASKNELKQSVGVAVDQTTGNVYVYDGSITKGTDEVVEYAPDGLQVITRFGEYVGEDKATPESPDKIHSSPYKGEIAVDGAGDVYVFDANFSHDFYGRLMEFKPKIPGDYKEYEYAGIGQDIGSGEGEEHWPSGPVMGAAGHIYVNESNEKIAEYDSSHPGSPPICHFEFKPGGITGTAVDPDSGEVFFNSYKSGAKSVHRLSSCDDEGEFVELETVKISPERDDLYALAFDPAMKFSTSRAAGVLYGGAPQGEPETGIGKGEPGQSSLGYIFAPVEENPPVVGSEGVSGVTTTSGLLHASIESKGFQTRYVFQYVTESAYEEGGESFTGASQAPLGGATIAGGPSAVSVSAGLAGLLSDTEYRYRVVASSHCDPSEEAKVCETVGPARVLRTYPVEAGGLPDGRVYELVSPVDKHDGQVLPADPTLSSCGEIECKPGRIYNHFPMLSSPDGEAVVYEGSPFSPSAGAKIENEYVSTRSTTGWQTTDVTPPLLESKAFGGYRVFDPELTRSILAQEEASPVLNTEAPSEYTDLYSQPVSDPLSLTALLTSAPPDRPASGASEFAIEYGGASADLSRVFFAANDALTGATPVAPAAIDGGPTKSDLYEWSAEGLRLVNVTPGNTETEPGASFDDGSAHAISTDGSRVYWSSSSGQVYVRIDGTETRKINDPGAFLSASTDGSRVLLNDGCLYDLQEEACVDITQGHGGLQGVAGQSDDLSHVYFVDTAVLTGEEANDRGEKAQAGQDNLYAWDHGMTRFVATLITTDNTNFENGSDWVSSPAKRTAEASPDGNWLAFQSTAPLTGYDSTGPCKGGQEGVFTSAPCPEVFVYDVLGGLRCVSCNSSGAAPLGWSLLRVMDGSPPSQPQFLSDTGRMVFDSRDSLTSADTNKGVEDVYEFEPDHVGSCDREAGCVSLISAGTGTSDSNFLAMDATGKNIFFTTRDRLLPEDRDELIDLYDAREGGGFPLVSSPHECQGENCQSNTTSTTNEPPPGSAAFEGTGNLLTIKSSLPPTVQSRTLTRKQKLTHALKVCHKKPRKARVACERTARKRYGADAKKTAAVLNDPRRAK